MAGAGKGSTKRLTNLKKYGKNFDNIFRKKKTESKKIEQTNIGD